MTEEEILKVINLLIGERKPHGSHGIDMDKIVPNVDLLGRITTELVSELSLIASDFESRPECSIQAVGKKARYWVDFIEDEILGTKKGLKGGEGMKIEVSYFKQSGKYYMEEEFNIPEPMIENFKSTKEPEELSKLTYHFRNWFEEVIQHDEFIAVVLTDYDLQPEQSNMLGFPMMVMPKQKKD